MTHHLIPAHHRYNADGQRYWKKIGSANPEYYIMDGSTALGYTHANGYRDWNVVTPGGEVVGRQPYNYGRRYYVKDHLGSVRTVVTGTGVVVETRDYYPFGLQMPGRNLVATNPAKENFTGHELDTESGLIYAGARYYMPNIGRWMSVDPLVHMYPSYSPYNYTLNNPVGLVDPDGKASVVPVFVVVAYIGKKAAAGAAVGAIASSGFDVASQLSDNQPFNPSSYSSDNNIDTRQALGAAGRGAVTGAINPFTRGASLRNQLAVSSIAEVAGGAVERSIAGGDVTDPTAILGDALAGGTGGAAYNIVDNVKISDSKSTMLHRTSVRMVQVARERLPDAARAAGRKIRSFSDRDQDDIEEERR